METKTEETVTTVEEAPQQVVRTTKQVTPQVVAEEHPQKAFKKKKAIFRTSQIIWYIVGLIEVLLGFRITLLALGANPTSGFTNLIYTLSDPISLPFRGIFGITVTSGSIFDWSILVAAAVYALIGYGLEQLMQLVKPVSEEEVVNTVDQV